MRQLIFSILILLAGITVSAQIYMHHPDAYYAPAPGSEKYFHDLQKESTDAQTLPKIQYRLDVGTLISRFHGSGSTVNTYLSPSIRYKVTPKLDVQIGGSIIYGFSGGSSVIKDIHGNDGNDPSYQFYIQGSYQVTDRMVINGSYLKSRINNPLFSNNFYQRNNDFESYSLGFNYRIANSIHIGAQIQVSNGMNPYYYSDPFYRRGTFQTDPFYQHW